MEFSRELSEEELKVLRLENPIPGSREYYDTRVGLGMEREDETDE